LPQAVDLAKKIARHGGLCVVLIHPDILAHKLAFEREFIEAVKDFSWFGTLGDYGEWWSARNEVQVDSEWQGNRLMVHLSAPKPLTGLTLEIPSGLRLDPQHLQQIGAEITGGRLLLDQLQGTSVISFSRQ